MQSAVAMKPIQQATESQLVSVAMEAPFEQMSALSRASPGVLLKFFRTGNEPRRGSGRLVPRRS